MAKFQNIHLGDFDESDKDTNDTILIMCHCLTCLEQDPKLINCVQKSLRNKNKCLLISTHIKL